MKNAFASSIMIMRIYLTDFIINAISVYYFLVNWDFIISIMEIVGIIISVQDEPCYLPEKLWPISFVPNKKVSSRDKTKIRKWIVRKISMWYDESREVDPILIEDHQYPIICRYRCGCSCRRQVKINMNPLNQLESSSHINHIKL